MSRVLVVANQKGGVGKTTTAINLGTALAAIGNKVLIVDIDPQGNASTGLGIARVAQMPSTFHVIVGEERMSQVIVPSSVPNLHVAPSTLDLLGVETEISQDPQRHRKIRNAIQVLRDEMVENGRDPYSYVLIDCPPSLNLLTINALIAADSVIIPLQCEFFALEGLSQILRTIEQVRQAHNTNLTIQGIVLTMFDSRNSLAGQVMADVRAFMGDKVYDTVIPRNVRISEAPSFGKPVLLYDLKCPGSQAYLRLASEVIQRERGLLAI